MRHVALFALIAALPVIARADIVLPAWNDPGDLPVPAWAK